MQKITPYLWYEGNAEDAMKFYMSVFKDSREISISRYGEEGPGAKGSVMVAKFQINGQEFIALNGGPYFKFTQAVSFVVNCDDQEEVNYYWEKLSEGGETSRCGWLKDKYGLSWQVVPTILERLLDEHKDAEKSAKVMHALMKMDKIIVSELEAAYNE